jgi:hypothetical protein
MPRFRVPVMMTLTARDATHAYEKVAYSSVTSLEIPGLMRITVCAAAPTTLRRRSRKQTTAPAQETARPLRCPNMTRA